MKAQTKTTLYRVLIITLLITLIIPLIVNTSRTNTAIKEIRTLSTKVALAPCEKKDLVEMYQTIINQQQQNFNWIIGGIGAFATILIGCIVVFNFGAARRELKNDLEDITKDGTNKLKNDVKKIIKEETDKLEDDVEIKIKTLENSITNRAIKTVDKKVEDAENNFNQQIIKTERYINERINMEIADINAFNSLDQYYKCINIDNYAIALYWIFSYIKHSIQLNDKNGVILGLNEINKLIEDHKDLIDIIDLKLLKIKEEQIIELLNLSLKFETSKEDIEKIKKMIRTLFKKKE